MSSILSKTIIKHFSKVYFVICKCFQFGKVPFLMFGTDYKKTIIKLFTKQQIIRLVQIESICKQQNKRNLKTAILFGKGRKHCGKRRKCWLPAFSPFPTMFSKGIFLKAVKSRNCFVLSQ